MKFAEVELRQIVEETWKIVLEEELEYSMHPMPSANIQDFVAACAQIAGDWQLAVALTCPVSVAKHAATAMFARAGAEQRPEDIEDAMCELINIISGNIKGILSGSSHLSLAKLIKGMDFKLMFPRHLLLSEVHFTFRNEPLGVTLLGEDKLALRVQRSEDTTGLQGQAVTT